MFTKSHDDGWVKMLDGVYRQTLEHGDNTLLIKARFDAGAEIPTHSHPHEQTGTLIRGLLEFVIDGETLRTEPGDTWCIPGGVEHSARALEDALVVEVFSPVREDYLP